jgi:hypothetical protein
MLRSSPLPDLTASSRRNLRPCAGGADRASVQALETVPLTDIPVEVRAAGSLFGKV